MNKILKYVLLGSVILALISTVSYCSAPFDTEVAQNVDIRKTVSGEGFILRNETVVMPTSKGAFEPAVQDGVRVARGSSLGVVISGNYDEKLVAELKEVTERIEEIEKSNNFADIYSSDEARIFSALKDLSSSIRTNVREEDYLLATENATQLNVLLQKKDSSENQGAGENLLLQLQQKKYELEQQLGGVRVNVVSPASGHFYSNLDGLEMKIKEGELLLLTPTSVSKYSEKLNSYSYDPQYAGKITDTYAWYLAAVLPEEKAQNLTVGNTVTLSVDDAPAVKATVMAINSDETNRYAVLLKSTHDAKDVFEKRAVTFEICYEEYSGLYVPSAAIRVVDGVTGVYILNQNETVSFRCVDIILKEKDYYIVRSKYTPPEGVKFSPLKLYDDILVNPEVASEDELKE